VTEQRFGSSSPTSEFKQLQWLPIEWRIRFKLATLLPLKHYIPVIPLTRPPYIAYLLQYHKPTKSTRSSASHLIYFQFGGTTISFGSRAFRISAPKILPLHILQSQTLDSFRRHLKDLQSAYPAPLRPSSMRPNSLLRLWRYI